VRTVVDRARMAGVKLGSVRIRMYRPFPERELAEALAGVERIGVLDRDISLGHGGILWSESRGALPGSLVQGYVLGLGGGDVRPEHLRMLLNDLRDRSGAGAPRMVEVGA
jgi:pyruvate/2-oxoacid:ferredoxin oxidoreductase alpha subunit